MNFKLLIFDTLNVIHFVKFHSNALLKPIGCASLSSKMCSEASRILFPPEELKGTVTFSKEAFSKKINLPVLKVPNEKLKTIQKLLTKCFVRLINFKNVESYPDVFLEKEGDCRCIFLNPDVVPTFESIDEPIRNELINFGITGKNFFHIQKTITFDNWKISDLIQAVLPDNLRFSGYTIVGHIAHFNLRSELIQYKYVLGMIVLNKVKTIHTVVNKVDAIDNTYRNFNMEVICGEKKLITTVSENSCKFEFDFSSVYWNSRLSTEHERIVKKMSYGDVLYDVFAGVGPFSVPAAKKGCIVLANDLNPESVRWLRRNVKLNKIEKLEIFNKDGKDFILKDVKDHLLQIELRNKVDTFKVHIVMNLPGLALEFLEHFKGLFSTEEYKKVPSIILVYVYFFVKHENRDPKFLKELARELVVSKLGDGVEKCIQDVFEVRHVSTNKDIFRVILRLEDDILCRVSKKRKAEEITENEINSGETISDEAISEELPD